mgnify:CR=1 FL=1
MELQVNGHNTFCYTGGKPFDPTLPCVVFIHGALNDHSVWTLLARSLAHHGYGVLAVDLPGHARSAGPVLPSVEATADWLLALLALVTLVIKTIAEHRNEQALKAAAELPPERPAPAGV